MHSSVIVPRTSRRDRPQITEAGAHRFGKGPQTLSSFALIAPSTELGTTVFVRDIIFRSACRLRLLYLIQLSIRI